MPRLVVGLLLLLLIKPAFAEAIQMRPQAGGYLISGRVNGAISLDFVLDTGASDVLIPEDAAQALTRAGKLAAGDHIGTRTYVLADGSRVPSKRIILRELQVGDQRVANVTASIGPAGTRPLLGQSFLSRFPSWMLDNQRHVLVLSTGGEAVGATASGQKAPTQSTGAGFGAVALDENTAKYGFGWNEDTQNRADEAALQGCNAEDCKIVFRIPPRRCGALATAETGKVAWGGKEHATRDGARLGAFENCQKRTSAKCVIRGSSCNR